MKVFLAMHRLMSFPWSIPGSPSSKEVSGLLEDDTTPPWMLGLIPTQADERKADLMLANGYRGAEYRCLASVIEVMLCSLDFRIIINREFHINLRTMLWNQGFSLPCGPDLQAPAKKCTTVFTSNPNNCLAARIVRGVWRFPRSMENSRSSEKTAFPLPRLSLHHPPSPGCGQHIPGRQLVLPECWWKPNAIHRLHPCR